MPSPSSSPLLDPLQPLHTSSAERDPVLSIPLPASIPVTPSTPYTTIFAQHPSSSTLSSSSSFASSTIDPSSADAMSMDEDDSPDQGILHEDTLMLPDRRSVLLHRSTTAEEEDTFADESFVVSATPTVKPASPSHPGDDYHPIAFDGAGSSAEIMVFADPVLPQEPLHAPSSFSASEMGVFHPIGTSSIQTLHEPSTYFPPATVTTITITPDLNGGSFADHPIADASQPPMLGPINDIQEDSDSAFLNVHPAVANLSDTSIADDVLGLHETVHTPLGEMSDGAAEELLDSYIDNAHFDAEPELAVEGLPSLWGKEALFSFEPALKHPIAMAAEEYGSFRVGSSAETLVFDDVAQDASRLLLSQEEENIFGSDPLQTIDLVAEDISVQEAYLIEGENVVLEHLPVIEEQAQALDSTMAAIPVIHDVVDHEQSFDAGPSQQPDSFIVDDKPLSESIGDSIISCAIPNEVVVVESDEVSVRVKDEDFDIDAPAITVSADIHSLEEGFVAEAPSIVVPSGYPVDSPVLNDTQPTMEATPTTAAFDVIGNTLSFDEYRHSIEIDRHSIKVPSETYARSFVSSILNDDESPTVAAEHVSDMVDEYKPSLGGHLDNSPAETYERSYVSSIVVDDPSIEAIPIAASAEPDRMFADEDKLSPETTLGNLALMVDGESRSIDSRFADVGVSEVISFYRPPIYSNQNDSVSPVGTDSDSYPSDLQQSDSPIKGYLQVISEVAGRNTVHVCADDEKNDMSLISNASYVKQLVSEEVDGLAQETYSSVSAPDDVVRLEDQMPLAWPTSHAEDGGLGEQGMKSPGSSKMASPSIKYVDLPDNRRTLTDDIYDSSFPRGMSPTPLTVVTDIPQPSNFTLPSPVALAGDDNSRSPPVPPPKSSSLLSVYPAMKSPRDSIPEQHQGPASSPGKSFSSRLPVPESSSRSYEDGKEHDFGNQQKGDSGEARYLSVVPMGSAGEGGSVKSLPMPAIPGFVELPQLKAFEPLRAAEVSVVCEMISSWPVLKSGYLLKTSNHLIPPTSLRSGGRSITSVIREAAGRALHMKQDFPPSLTRTDSHGSVEEEEHIPFFVEIREHYIFFYSVQNSGMTTGGTMNTAMLMPPLPPPKDFMRPESPSSARINNGAPRDTTKAISKFFKKTQEYVQNKRRPSVADFRNVGKLPGGGSGNGPATSASRPSSPFGEKESRPSTESSRSNWGGVGASMQELRRAPRTLFTYISLRDASAEVRATNSQGSSSDSHRHTLASAPATPQPCSLLLTVPYNGTQTIGRHQPVQYCTFQFEVLHDGPDTFDTVESSYIRGGEAFPRVREAEEWSLIIREITRREKKSASSIRSLPDSAFVRDGRGFDMGKVPSMPTTQTARAEIAKHSGGSSFGLSKSVPSAADSPLLGDNLPITPPKSPLVSRPSHIELPRDVTTSYQGHGATSPLGSVKTPVGEPGMYFGRSEGQGGAGESKSGKPIAKIFGNWKKSGYFEKMPELAHLGNSGTPPPLPEPYGDTEAIRSSQSPGPETSPGFFKKNVAAFASNAVPAGKPVVISGPTDFKKMEISPEMVAAMASMSTIPPYKPDLPPRRPTTTPPGGELIQNPYGNDRRSMVSGKAPSGFGDDRPSVWKSYWKTGANDEPYPPPPSNNPLSAAFQGVTKEKRRDQNRKRDWKKHQSQSYESSFGVVGVPTDIPPPPLTQVHPGDEKEGKAFFPFFNKPLWTGKKEKENGGANLQRSGTVGSKGSTLRRKVTARERPPSGSTQKSGTGVGEVPVVLKKCIRLIEEIGMETEGLYRISGSAVTVDRLRKLFEADPTKVHLRPPASTALISSLTSPQLQDHSSNLLRRGSRLSLTETISSARSSMEANVAREAFQVSEPIKVKSGKNVPIIPPRPATRPDTGKQVAAAQLPVSNLYDNDIHVVTGVVKGFLRDGLPPSKEALCTSSLYEGFIAAAQVETWRERMIAMQDMVHNLPTKHFDTLKFLCEHLQRVSSFSAHNKMTQKNLSIIFGPTLLKPPPHLDTLPRIMADMPYQCKVVEVLLEQTEWIFGPIEFEDEEILADEDLGSLSRAGSVVSRDVGAGIGYFDLFENDGGPGRGSTDLGPSEVGSNLSATADVGAASYGSTVPVNPMMYGGGMSPSYDGSPVDPKQLKKDRRRGHFGMEGSFNAVPAGANPYQNPLWEQFRNISDRPQSRESDAAPVDEDREARNQLRRSRTTLPASSSPTANLTSSRRPVSAASSTTSRTQRRMSTSAVSPGDVRGPFSLDGHPYAGVKGAGLGGSSDDVFEPTKDAFRLSLNLDLSLSSFLDVDRMNAN